MRSLSERLAKNHEVTVFTTSAIDRRHDFEGSPLEIESNGYRVVYFDRLFSFSGLDLSPCMARAIKETLSEYDIIHIHSWRHFQDVVVSYYAKKFHIPYILQVHGSLATLDDSLDKKLLKKGFDLFFGRQIIRNSSKVIALSNLEFKQYLEMGVSKNNIAIIPNGVDSSFLKSLPTKGSFKKRLGMNEKQKIILYLGRISANKGIDFLIKAFNVLVNELNVLDLFLVIAGPDFGYLKTAKRLIRSFGISDRTIFVGALTEREKMYAYRDSTVVINVEPHNVFGLVPLEAATCSTPVIVGKNNAISEIVHKGGFGFSVEMDDIDELARLINHFHQNEQLAKQMGERGREFVSANFNWSILWKKFEQVYFAVLSSKKTRFFANEN